MASPSGGARGAKAPIIKQGQTSGQFGNDPAVKEVDKPPTPYSK